jgi:hypothetical protein
VAPWTPPDGSIIICRTGPHGGSPAHYALNERGLQLLIDADKPAWHPEDGELRVSFPALQVLAASTAPPPAGTWRSAALSLHSGCGYRRRPWSRWRPAPAATRPACLSSGLSSTSRPVLREWIRVQLFVSCLHRRLLTQAARQGAAPFIKSSPGIVGTFESRWLAGVEDRGG